MTSAISRAANAAHAHGFAKSVKNEAPAEGFEALFAAVANPVATPAVSPAGAEHGKPGESAREDEKKGAPNAFELAAAIALVAVDSGRSDLRAAPNAALTTRAALDTVTEQAAAPRSPRAVASHPSPDFVVRAPAQTPAFVPNVSSKEMAKPEGIETPIAHGSRAMPEVEPEALRANPPPPTIAANPLPAKPAPMPPVEVEAVVTHGASPNEAPAPHAEPIASEKIAARPRVELSPRALAQAAIVEAIRSPGRSRSQPVSEAASAPKNPEVATPAPVRATAVAPNAPMPVAQPVAEAMALLADAPPLAEPTVASPAPGKPAASSRAAADILRQRQYALGADTSPTGDIVPESAASFETLIALRKADGALENPASPSAEHEFAAPVSSGAWLANLPTSAASATTASAILAPRAFDQTAWSAALAQQVTASAIAAAKETTVRVEPEGLGPIEVRVRISSEHVDVRFAIEHPVTVNMVRAALPDLEKMLAQSGLNLGDAQIAQQNAGHREHALPNRSPSSSSANASDDEPVVVASALESRPRARVGLLDDFV